MTMPCNSLRPRVSVSVAGGVNGLLGTAMQACICTCLGTCRWAGRENVLSCMQAVIQIFFHVFRAKNGRLDYSALDSAMYSKYQHTKLSTASSPGKFKCILDCVRPVQP